MTAALRANIALPLIGLPATVEREVRIDGMEPFITDAMYPRILFDPSLTQLLAELDSWPEKQAHHDYDGLCALYILWDVAVRYGASTAATGGFKSVPRSGRGNDDNGGGSRRML